VIAQEIFGVQSTSAPWPTATPRRATVTIAPCLYDRIRRGIELGYSEKKYRKDAAIACRSRKTRRWSISPRPSTSSQHAGRVAVSATAGRHARLLAACELPVACAVSYYGGQIKDHLAKSPRGGDVSLRRERSLHPPADIEKIRAADPNGRVPPLPGGSRFNCEERAQRTTPPARNWRASARSRSSSRNWRRNDQAQAIRSCGRARLHRGAWRAADSGQTTEIRNPALGELLGAVPNMGAAETRRAIEARRRHAGWAKKTAGERAKIMRSGST
jgi:hypothetical protein